MKLFSVRTLQGDKDGYLYAVKFSNEESVKDYRNRYGAALGKIPDKKFDLKNREWKIKENSLRILQEAEEELWPTSFNKPKETQPIIRDYEDIGLGLKLKPYPYQQETIKFCLDTEKSLIVLPCGAGKSAILLGTYDECRKAKTVDGPAMIVAKASLKQQWAKEVEKFTSYKPIIIQTLSQLNKNQEVFEAQFEGADVYILNYESLRDPEIKKRLHKIKFSFVAADEIQLCKDDTTKRAKALAEFHYARYTIGATATPVQKTPMDIFGIFKFIDPSLFPRKGDFGNRYVTWTTFGQYIKKPIGAKNTAELNAKLKPYMIVKSKHDISSQLPKLVVTQRTCTFTPQQQKRNELLLKTLSDLKEKERAEMTKLAKAGAKDSKELKKIESEILMYQTFAQEFANDELLLLQSETNLAKKFVTGGKSSKTELLIDLIKEIIGSGEKVAVFSRFVKYQDIIKDRVFKEKELQDVKIAAVHGALSDKQRYEEIYTKFRDDPDYKILLLSDAAAEGVNLSNCGYIIELDLAQSYALQTQRHGRIERADSTHDTVYVYQLLTEDSYDSIAEKIVNKKETYDAQIIKGDISQ